VWGPIFLNGDDLTPNRDGIQPIGMDFAFGISQYNEQSFAIKTLSIFA